MEAEYVVGEKDAVIYLADAGQDSASKVNSKVGTLSLSKLVVVGQFVEPVTHTSYIIVIFHIHYIIYFSEHIEELLVIVLDGLWVGGHITVYLK